MLSSDPFDWLSDLYSTRTQAFIAREEQRFDQAFRPALATRDAILNEIISRRPSTYAELAYRQGSFLYRRRYPPGCEYPIFERRPFQGGEWRCLLDFGSLRAGGSNLSVHLALSPDADFLAYASDPEGIGSYTIRVRNLTTCADLDGTLANASGNMGWCGRTLFFTEVEASTFRWSKIARASIDQGYVARRDTAFDERDPTFSCFVEPAKSGRYLFLCSTSGLSDEAWLVAADRSTAAPRLIARRRLGLEYSVQHDGGSLIIRTNHFGPSFGIATAPIDNPDITRWHLLHQADADAFLDDWEVIGHRCIVRERTAAGMRLTALEQHGRKRCVIHQYSGGESVRFRDNHHSGATQVRIETTSLADASRTWDVTLPDHVFTLREIEPIKNLDLAEYRGSSVAVPAEDGEMIPVSLLMHRHRSGVSGPVLLYVYGGYGFSIDPALSIPRMSLLDRGFAFVIAHVRGGGERGRRWHEAGRGPHKKTPVDDFLAIARYLHAEKITDRDGLFAMGESAGGYVVASALNRAPELFAGALLNAPFVDIANTLGDPALPMTTTDYVEWGNPADPEVAARLRRLSPYDGIVRQPYPPVLALARRNDQHVAAWEATKWIARLAASSTSRAPALLAMDTDGGHLGRSGRHEKYLDVATLYAFAIAIHSGEITRRLVS